jgi:hypothetical protein
MADEGMAVPLPTELVAENTLPHEILVLVLDLVLALVPALALVLDLVPISRTYSCEN